VILCQHSHAWCGFVLELVVLVVVAVVVVDHPILVAVDLVVVDHPTLVVVGHPILVAVDHPNLSTDQLRYAVRQPQEQ